MLKGYIVLTENYNCELYPKPEGSLYMISTHRKPMTKDEAEEFASQIATKHPEATIYITKLVMAVKVNQPIVKIPIK